jgi:hypothetical protein
MIAIFDSHDFRPCVALPDIWFAGISLFRYRVNQMELRPSCDSYRAFWPLRLYNSRAR